MVAILWLASRLFYGAIGLRLDDTTLPYFWQFLDLELLRTRPLESVFYQHTQPPLFNLYLAAVLRTTEPRVAFHVVGWAFGLALHLGLFDLARRLGARRRGAIALAGAFAFYPASALLESWVMYTYPVAALLVVSAALLHRGLATRRVAVLASAFALMAVVVLTRSLFHLAWLVGVVSLVALFARDRRRVWLAAALPLVLATSVYAKNALVFGRFSSSTWLGPSLARLTTTEAPPSLRRRLVASGELTPVALTLPWLALDAYPEPFRQVPAGTPDVPALRETTRSTGFPNYNHIGYAGVADAFLADATRLLRESPRTWWAQTRRAWRIYFIPIHDHSFFFARRVAVGGPMRAVERVYEVLTGAPGFLRWTYGDPLPPFSSRPGWAGAVVWALSLLWAVHRIGVCRRSPALAATLAYVVFTIAFVALVGNSVEVNENNRFRFLTEPLSWCCVLLAADAVRRAATRLRPFAARPPRPGATQR